MPHRKSSRKLLNEKLIALPQIERPGKLFAEIATALVNSIMAQEFLPSERLPSERELANHFTVSRATVREALSALEIAQILVVKQGNGVFVAENAVSNASKIFEVTLLESPMAIMEVRFLFEPGVSKLAAARRQEENLHEMRGHQEIMKAHLDEGLDSWAADWGFHAAIATSTKNSSIISVTRNLKQQMEGPMWALMRARNIKNNNNGYRYFDDHELIYEAIRNSDQLGAEKTMRSHLENILQNLSGETSKEEGGRAHWQIKSGGD